MKDNTPQPIKLGSRNALHDPLLIQVHDVLAHLLDLAEQAMFSSKIEDHMAVGDAVVRLVRRESA